MSSLRFKALLRRLGVLSKHIGNRQRRPQLIPLDHRHRHGYERLLHPEVPALHRLRPPTPSPLAATQKLFLPSPENTPTLSSKSREITSLWPTRIGSYPLTTLISVLLMFRWTNSKAWREVWGGTWTSTMDSLLPLDSGIVSYTVP